MKPPPRIISDSWRVILPFVTLLSILLSGCVEVAGYCPYFCYDNMPVQTAYVAQRDQCQLLAERKIFLYADPERPPSPKERNTILLALFSECMHGKDWGVTAPKREDEGGRSVAVSQAEPPVAEQDVVVVPGEAAEEGGVVLPERMYRQPGRDTSGELRPSSGPLVGEGIGPGYGSGETPGAPQTPQAPLPAPYYLPR